MGSLDADWLRGRVEAGATLREIAAEAGRHPRPVRDWLNRYRIPRPSPYRNQQGAAGRARRLPDRNEDGRHHRHASGEQGVDRGSGQGSRGHERSAGDSQGGRGRFPQLEDAAWLRARLEEAGTQQIAHEVGSSPRTVRAAIASRADRWPSATTGRQEPSRSAAPRSPVAPSRLDSVRRWDSQLPVVEAPSIRA